MVGRVYKSIECWKYKGLTPTNPVVKVSLSNLIGEKIKLLDIPIDTGFSGSILVPQTMFEYFKIGELPPKYRRTYKTIIGKIVMRVARGFIDINSVNMEVFIETPLFGSGKLLAGREVLNKLILILDGLNECCCLSNKD